MSNIQIAETIYEQLSRGRRVLALMTGAKDFVAIDNGTVFSLPARSAKNGINRVRITLLPSDTYKVEFLKYRPRQLDVVPVTVHEDIYCDQLKDIFEKETGLYLSFR